MSTLPRMTNLVRNEEFTSLGFCEDGSVRVMDKVGGSGLHLPATHADFAKVAAFAYLDPEAFESAVMSTIYG